MCARRAAPRGRPAGSGPALSSLLLATGLDSAAAALGDEAEGDGTVAADIRLMARRLVGEVRLQRALASEGNGIKVAPETIAAGATLGGLRDVLEHHPAARGRSLVVLASMIVNALEATPEGGEGRGQGTFAMKLFGEAYLGGEVSFETAEGAGTTFELRLPRRGR